MNKLFFKKIKILSVALAIVGVLGLFFLISLFVFFPAKAGINNRIVELEKKFAGYKNGYPLAPREKIKELKDAGFSLEQEYLQVKEIFLKQKPLTQDEASPLSFKQRLFEFQDRIKKKADIAQAGLPESLGFKEYALNVPKETESGLLMRELILAEEVMDVLLDSRVFAVLSLKAPHKEALIDKKIKDVTQLKLSGVSLEVSFEADFAKIEKILKELSLKERIFIIKKILIQQKSETEKRLIASFEIDNISLAGQL